jgi:hypothetical protein
MPLVGLELTISAREQPQTYTLDRVATWTSQYILTTAKYFTTEHMTTKKALTISTSLILSS